MEEQRRARGGIVIAAAALLALAGALAWGQYRRTLPAGRVLGSLTPGVQKAARARGLALARKYHGFVPTPDADRLAQQGWQEVRRQMLAAGAEPREADGVIGAAQAAFAKRWPAPYHGVFMQPVLVRASWAEGRRVWALGFCWGLRDINGPGWTEAGGHYQVYLIERRTPFAIVAEVGCA